ncbi:polyphenol oxidase, chloroplastic-like, partial [Lotus japonicus]|uniref:polyphenol oxidase, chloroplastic-like n=1 Tax=Lotus japonicus TaxID=34305 RepID=UPI00258B2398
IHHSKPIKRHQYHHHHVACSSNTTPSPNTNNNNIDGAAGSGHRRDVLIGLCGGAATTLFNINNPLAAIAAPVLPDFNNCGPATLPKCPRPPYDCCPPPNVSGSVKTFRLPLGIRQSRRIRLPAHQLPPEYLSKYKTALNRMKNLKDDDPRSFKNQAKVHCAYCNGAYHQIGFPNVEFPVHKSWLFLPFHRWYLYFFERILGHLIEDPTFAIPFWNWDAPDGMTMPFDFTCDPNSPLYDPLRNTNHMPATLMDLGRGLECLGNVHKECVPNVHTNLTILHRVFVDNGKTPGDFLGGAYRAGETAFRKGSLENLHDSIHQWTGDPNQPNGEDMGSFYSAARDPIFYAHHANVDRMWSVRNELGLGGTTFNDPDWLQSGFFFYDEHKQLVRVNVGDCLFTADLGYVYKDVDNLWTDPKYAPKPAKSRAQRLEEQAKRAPVSLRKNYDDVKFPLALDEAVTLVLKRPQKSRSKSEKEEVQEVLSLEGIEFDSSMSVKFDVIIDEEDYKLVNAGNAEFAGSFLSVPHSGGDMNMNMKTDFRLALTDLLERLEAEDDESVLVTLVPRDGRGIKIQGIKIELI